ncbi:unnamed protein product [Meloidogyne enterolobii]|uniref:Uncharacterized protein n=1 Tax=Meloidogyne enterolobii TaxID=390850 RepID=A0ACB1A7H7_MELEN
MPAEKQKSYDELPKVLSENERKSLLNRLVVQQWDVKGLNLWWS